MKTQLPIHIKSTPKVVKFNLNSITPIKPTRIFSFTEIFDNYDLLKPTDNTSSQKKITLKLSPAMTSFEKAFRKQSPVLRKSKDSNIGSLTDEGLDLPQVKLLHTSSTKSNNLLHEDSGSLSTLNTLQYIPSEQNLGSSDEKKEKSEILPELFEEEIEDFAAEPIIKEANVKKFMSRGRLRSSANEILEKSKDFQKEMTMLGERVKLAEKRYEGSLDYLEESLNQQGCKFEFWKKDEPFLRKRVEIKKRIEEFCAPIKQEKERRAKERELDYFLPQEADWEGKDEENEGLDDMERLILKEARPFRIKKVLSKREQFDLRGKSQEIKRDFLRPERETKLMTLNDYQENQDQNVVDEEDQMRKLRMKRKEILKNVKSVKEMLTVKKPSEIDKIFKSTSFVIKPKPEESSNSKKIYYFVGIKKIQGNKLGLKKDQVVRQCVPTAAEPKERPYNFKESFANFKKSSLASRRNKAD